MAIFVIMSTKNKIYQSHFFNKSIFVVFCLFLLFFVSLACQKKPVSIPSGDYQCHNCKMLISDLRFHSQKINTKGKHFHYDSIECMVWDRLKSDSHNKDKFYVKDIQNNNYIQAGEAFYLRSSALPSPMGANLSAYSSQADRDQALQNYAGINLSFANMIDYVQNIKTHQHK